MKLVIFTLSTVLSTTSLCALADTSCMTLVKSLYDYAEKEPSTCNTEYKVIHVEMTSNSSDADVVSYAAGNLSKGGAVPVVGIRGDISQQFSDRSIDINKTCPGDGYIHMAEYQNFSVHHEDDIRLGFVLSGAAIITYKTKGGDSLIIDGTCTNKLELAKSPAPKRLQTGKQKPGISKFDIDISKYKDQVHAYPKKDMLYAMKDGVFYTFSFKKTTDKTAACPPR